jgi:formylmethanofuran dehydrogenase subunit A
VKSVPPTIARAATGLECAVDTKAGVVLILSNDQDPNGGCFAKYPVVRNRSLDRPKAQNLFYARGIILSVCSSGESCIETVAVESEAGKRAYSSLRLT